MGIFSDASTTSPEYEENINVTLKRSRHSHLNNVIFSYLNINSIRNKFGDLDKIVNGNIDIKCIAETKFDESFPNNQFVLVGYHLPYRLDITDKKGGLMVFVKSHIPLRRLNAFKIPSNIQIVPFEINLRKEKWLFASIYKAPSKENKYFLWYLTDLLEFYSTLYGKVIVLGDFNIEVENKAMKDFLQEHTFCNMMKQNTCFKSDGGSCIDLLITNSKFSFMKTNCFETGLSDHHHMIYTILKTKFEVNIPQFQTI